MPAVAADPAHLPVRAGIGLKAEHVAQILAEDVDLGFFEVHAENYMVPGGPFPAHLGRIRECYALSIHGVGLSIGSEAGLDSAHLDRLDALLRRFEPQSFSEHLAWSSHGGTYYNDLLPLPYDTPTLQRVCRHIDQVQTRLGRRMLIENPSTYVEFACSTLDEGQFLSEVVRRTGCGLLLDVNNVHVSAVNHHRDARAWLESLPLHAVGEVHIAGYGVDADAAGAPLLIDTHGADIDAAVWALYAHALQCAGAQPTLIERDQNIPALAALLAEAAHAERLLLACQAVRESA